MTDAGVTDALEGPSRLLDVSNAVVHLYKEQLGRGPTRARSAYAGPDTLVVTLEQTMVPAERTLVELGEGARMAESRLITMRGAEAEFNRVVEGIIRRKVRAMVCGVSAEHDISTKVFYLEPESRGQTSPAAG